MASNRTGHDESEESFFVSMTDIMVGLLFIFIILVVYFVLQVRIETQKVRYYEDEYGPEQSQRSQLDIYRIAVSKQQSLILEGLQSFFKKEGFDNVTIDRNNGVLRFPDGVLFGSGEYDFEDGTKTASAVKTLANAFAEVLPCSVLDAKGNRFQSKAECRLGHTSFPNPNNAFVESIYIEGHTDSIPIGLMGLRGDAKLSTNLKLSTRRATNTYEKVINQRPEIQGFHGLSSVSNQENGAKVEPALAVSGYGEQRPIADNTDSEGRSATRRIDVRIVMYRPYNFEDLEILRTKLISVVVKDSDDLD